MFWPFYFGQHNISTNLFSLNFGVPFHIKLSGISFSPTIASLNKLNSEHHNPEKLTHWSKLCSKIDLRGRGWRYKIQVRSINAHCRHWCLIKFASSSWLPYKYLFWFFLCQLICIKEFCLIKETHLITDCDLYPCIFNFIRVSIYSRL